MTPDGMQAGTGDPIATANPLATSYRNAHGQNWLGEGVKLL